MSNRNNAYIEWRSETGANPITVNISPIIEEVGNVRLSNIQLPRTFADARANAARNTISITGDNGTHVVALDDSTFTNPNLLSQKISCLFTKEETGFTEDIISGWDVSSGLMNVRSVIFAPEDINKQKPIQGTMPIIINSTTLMGPTMAGFTLPTVSAVKHVADVPDKLYEYRFLYITSPELVVEQTNTDLIRLNGTPTDTCFVVPFENTNYRSQIRTFLSEIQVFYNNVAGLGGLGKDFSGNVSLAIRYRDGTLVDFKQSPISIILRLDPVVPQF